jgi:RNA polymerase sigma factor (sigma-70 family)
MAAVMKDFLEIVRDLALRDGKSTSDGELLLAYLHRRDEPAMSALVRRHSAMVWGVCRRILGVGQDAEDAFQATFLVLTKKAADIRAPEKVANWLYGVAQQTAARMRSLRAQRGNRERQVDVMPERAVANEVIWKEIEPWLDEELSRLPEKYRTLIVLCDLQEKPRSAVANQLGCPEGTVA